MILRHGPSAVEVMDRFILDHARESPALDRLRRSILQTDPGGLLCVELYAERPEDLLPRLDALEKALGDSGVRCRYRRALTGDEQARIWSLREAALGLSMAMKGDAKSLSFVEDTAVAPEKLHDYIERFLEIVSRHGTVAGVYAHASVGCLHVRPVVNLKTAEGVRRFEAIANDIADLVLEFGGALSGEHGDGLVRGPFTEKMFGPTLYQAFRTIKRAFDPDGLFNPGKIVDTPPLTANLRYGPAYRTAEPPTYFDFSEHGGFGRAVEMCSGVGACRKKLDGTMCPSYMATVDEKDSTRGRANTLRLALSGRLGSVAPAGPNVRWVSTWRASRASSWRPTGGVTACPGGHGLSATPTRWRSGAVGLHRSRTSRRGARWDGGWARGCSASIAGGGCLRGRDRRSLCASPAAFGGITGPGSSCSTTRSRTSAIRRSASPRRSSSMPQALASALRLTGAADGR
jgi:hypothetical protein